MPIPARALRAIDERTRLRMEAVNARYDRALELKRARDARYRENLRLREGQPALPRVLSALPDNIARRTRAAAKRAERVAEEERTRQIIEARNARYDAVRAMKRARDVRYRERKRAQLPRQIPAPPPMPERRATAQRTMRFANETYESAAREVYYRQLVPIRHVRTNLDGTSREYAAVIPYNRFEGVEGQYAGATGVVNGVDGRSIFQKTMAFELSRLYVGSPLQPDDVLTALELRSKSFVRTTRALSFRLVLSFTRDVETDAIVTMSTKILLKKDMLSQNVRVIDDGNSFLITPIRELFMQAKKPEYGSVHIQNVVSFTITTFDLPEGSGAGYRKAEYLEHKKRSIISIEGRRRTVRATHAHLGYGNGRSAQEALRS